MVVKKRTKSLSLRVKNVDGVWTVNGSADHDSNFQNINYSSKDSHLAGELVKYLMLIYLTRYPESTVQICGDSDTCICSQEHPVKQYKSANPLLSHFRFGAGE